MLTNSRAAASERRSPQPRIDVTRRNLHGCRRPNPPTTAKLSSSDRKRCCGVNDSSPIWTRSAGRTRMFRTQSASGPQPEQMTASWVCGSYLKTMATIECGLPVFRPAWTSSRNVWPSSPPHPWRYSGSGSRKTASARRPGSRRSPSSGFAARPGRPEAAELPNRHHSRNQHKLQQLLSPLADISTNVQARGRKSLLSPGKNRAADCHGRWRALVRWIRLSLVHRADSNNPNEQPSTALGRRRAWSDGRYYLPHASI